MSALTSSFPESSKENRKKYTVIRLLETKKETYPIELIEQTSDLLTANLERILKAIDNSKQEEAQPDSIDNLRNSFKMTIFLIFYLLNNSITKTTKGSLKEEIKEVALGKAGLDKKKNQGKVAGNWKRA